MAATEVNSISAWTQYPGVISSFITRL